MSIRLVPADALDFGLLVEVFNTAFADYFMPVCHEAGGLRKYIDAQDIDLGSSFVAFSGEEAAGFVLTGIRKTDDGLTVRVDSMGVAPKHRRNGVATILLAEIRRRAEAMGAGRIILEVIQANSKAIALYAKQGYQVVRELKNFQWGQLPLPGEISLGLTLRPMGLEEAEAASRLCYTYRLPWQIDRLTLKKLWAPYECFRAETGGQPVGFAVLVPREDSVHLFQMGVIPTARRKGIARAMLAELQRAFAHLSRWSVLYVPADERAAVGLAEKLGCQEFFPQYEMQLLL
ncbi:MAG: GNAT family N-acetyltransferase [Syntrophothermus sp.]